MTELLWEALRPLCANESAFNAAKSLIESSLLPTPQHQTPSAQLQKPTEVEALLHAVYDSNAIGICLTDHQGIFVDVNKAYCETYGYSREELVGQHFSMVIPETDKLKYAGAHSAFISGDEEVDGEWLLQRKDGELRNIYVKASRLISKDGSRFKVTSVQDITEKKKTERLIEEQKVKLQAFFDSTEEAIILLYPDLRIFALNKSAVEVVHDMSGVNVNVGDHIEVFGNMIDFPELLFKLKSTFAGERYHDMIDVMMRGTMQSWQISLFPLYGSDEVIFGAAFSLKNITELKSLSKELNERNAFIASLGDSMPNLMLFQYITDTNGNPQFTFLSKGAYALTGYSEPDILRDPEKAFNGISPADLQVLKEKRTHAQEAMKPVEVGVQKVKPDGNRRYSLIRALPRRVSDEKIVWDGYEIDITALQLAQQKIEQSEALLSETEKLAKIGSWEYDLRTGVIHWSNEIFRIYDRPWSEGSPSYEEFLTYHTPKSIDQFELLVKRALDFRIPYQLDAEVITKSGKEVFVRGFGNPIVENDRVVKLIGYVRDITNEIRSERELLQNQSFLQSIFYGVDTAIFVIDVEQGGAEFRVIGANPAHERLTGLKTEQISGRRISELHDLLFETAISEIQARYTACVETKTVVQYEDKINTSDLPKYCLTTLTPLFDTNHKVYRIIGLIVDLTERQKMQERIRENDQLHRETEEIAKIGGWVYAINHPSSEGAFKCSNQFYRILELDPEETSISLKRILGFIQPNYLEVYRPLIKGALNEGRPFEIEMPLRLKNGRTKWVHIVGKTKYDHKGLPKELYGTVMDISARKDSELVRERLFSQLIQSQKMESLGIMASGVAHEFNNILAGIVGYAGLLKRSLPETSKDSKRVEQILLSSDRAATIIRQMLGFARQGKVESKPFQLDDCVKNVQHIITPILDKRIELRCDYPTTLPFVQGDKGQLEQVILNLILNSRDAILERIHKQESGEGVISLTIDVSVVPTHFLTQFHLKADGKFLHLAIHDDGIGIPKEHVDKIFQPFFTTKETGKGTGLGLAMAYGIIKNHNGFIFPESETGQGTTFHLYLPIMTQAEHPAEVTVPQSVKGEPVSATVMIVDDEELIREIMKEVLESEGVKVVSLKSGIDAVQYLKSNPEYIDLVVLDMNMPKQNGHETFRKMRELRPELKVMLCTGYLENDELLSLKEKGIAYILPKPFELNELILKVIELVREGRMNQ